MKEIYLEAKYRILGKVYSNGYICIDDNMIKGLFTTDLAILKIVDGSLYFFLSSFDPTIFMLSPPETFVCEISSDTLECPNTYTLKSLSSNTNLELSLIRKVTELYSIPSVINDFKTLFHT